MNFRKVVFALATAGLGLTGIANAQVTCNTATPTPNFVRVEGTTEVVGTLTITGCTAGATTPTSITINVTTSATITNTNVSGQSYTDATANFFGTTAPADLVNGTLSGGVLTFTATGTQIGSTMTSGIVINGVRVNASSVPANTNITESVTSGGGVILSNATSIVVASTQPTMAKPVVAGLANQPVCSATTNTTIPLLAAEIISGFAGSFNASPGGKLYIAVTFGNLLSGANYYVPVTITGAGSAAPAALTATLVSSNSSTTAVASGTIGSGSNQVGSVAQLSVTGGTATALYYITGGTVAPEGFIVPLYAVIPSALTSGTSAPPTVSAMPTSASSGYDQFSSTQTPTVVAAAEGGTSSAPALLNPTGIPVPITGVPFGGGTFSTPGLGELSPCGTTLLLPYLVNIAGYDSGVAIINASGGTPGSSAQSGTCSVQFYGTGAPTGSSNPYVTSSIASNAIGTFVVSGVAPGFQGYAIATCNFESAHAFAFITDGFGQPSRGYSEGYLAPVISAFGVAASSTLTTVF